MLTRVTAFVVERIVGGLLTGARLADDVVELVRGPR
jgi:hypothetical protein